MTLDQEVEFVETVCWLWWAEDSRQPVIVSNRSTWTLWQYTDSGSVQGVSDSVDRDAFNGDQGQLRQLWG